MGDFIYTIFYTANLGHTVYNINKIIYKWNCKNFKKHQRDETG